MCARGKHSRIGGIRAQSAHGIFQSGHGDRLPPRLWQCPCICSSLRFQHQASSSCFTASEWPWSAIMAIFWALISFFRNELVDISSKIQQCWMGRAVAEFLYFREGTGAQTENHKRHTSYQDLDIWYISRAWRQKQVLPNLALIWFQKNISNINNLLFLPQLLEMLTGNAMCQAVFMFYLSWSKSKLSHL